MSRSKKDGRHGGSHKMHWTHDNCRERNPYCWMDNCGNCGGCRWLSTCRKHGAYDYKKKEKDRLHHLEAKQESNLKTDID